MKTIPRDQTPPSRTHLAKPSRPTRRAFPPASILLVLMTLSPGMSTPLAAAEEPSGETIVIGLEEFEIYPYGTPSETEIYTGYLRDLMESFAADRGASLELVVWPAKRLQIGFKDGEIDLYVVDHPQWAKEYKVGLDMTYSRVVAVALDGFLVLPGREGETLGKGGIERLSLVRGTTPVEFLEQARGEGIVVDYAPDFEQLVRSLLLGRADAIYSNVAITRHVLEVLGKDPAAVSWSSALPRAKAFFYISSATRPDLIADFDHWLETHPVQVRDLKQRYGLLADEGRAWGEVSPNGK